MISIKQTDKNLMELHVNKILSVNSITDPDNVNVLDLSVCKLQLKLFQSGDEVNEKDFHAIKSVIKVASSSDDKELLSSFKKFLKGLV
ncbi:CLUMA_CG018578, isoform A [Clunio marinus]|uniref:CLUMA_CG018578, isoform A n=1 Tax=Clunio marinus TaxID=568069 RepID=A0A1J1J0F1_9DIPT|nr:CLUMA_CG018578, isoform A [Clunio marinus]